MAHHDPRERIKCPCCNKPCVAEDGVAYLTKYHREEEEWTLGYLIYCSWKCVLGIVPTEGSC